MNLFVCEHPKKIINPYTGDELVVPCGKCAACRVRHSYEWVSRLEIERMCHPYTVFFTLTYNEAHCPKWLLCNDNNSLVDNRSGEILSFDDFNLNRPLMLPSRQYVLKNKSLCYPSVDDIQKFLKRLRSKLAYNEKDSSKKRIRYYIVSEYGPTNHRIHYHGLLFFESSWFAENIEECISAAWCDDNRSTDGFSYGFTDYDFVQGSATSYCAQYLNCTSHLPKIYEDVHFRTFSLQSRHPPIGSLVVKQEEIQKIFNYSSPTMRIPDRQRQSFVDVPLPKSLEDRLFPRIKGFNDFPHEIRVELYGYLEKSHCWISSYDDFMDSLVHIDNFSTDCQRILNSYRLPEFESASHRYYSLLVRCDNLRYQFGLSFNDLVFKIEEYYSKKNFERLKEQVKFQESYDGDVSDLLFIDSLFHHRLLWKKELTESDKLILQSYGWKEDEMSAYDFLYSKDYSRHIDFINLVSRSNTIFEHSHKTKKKKEFERKERQIYDF